MIAAFPWHSLPKLTAGEIEARRRAAARLRGPLDLPRFSNALAELLGAEVSVRRTIEGGGGHRPSGVGVLVGFGAEDARARFLLEVEPTLAVTLTRMALGQRAPRIVDTARADVSELAGATAAVVHAALRRTPSPVPPRIVAAGPAGALAADLANADRSAQLHRVPLVIAVGPDRYDAGAWILDLPSPADASLAIADALGQAPLELSLVVATAQVSREDLALLEPGDALLFDAPTLTRGEGDALRGDATLLAPASEIGISARLADGDTLVVRKTTHVSWDAPRPPASGGAIEEPMPEDVSKTSGRSPASSEANASQAFAAAIDDAPVVVRVELGAVQMSARAWSNLSEGDVISLGRKVGAPALLRVGGVEVARGELVLVDGEYAVRIVSRSLEQQ